MDLIWGEERRGEHGEGQVQGEGGGGRIGERRWGEGRIGGGGRHSRMEGD